MCADRGTHLKIVAVALTAATIFVGVGITARIAGTSTTTARIDSPVFIAGKPLVYTSRELSAFR